MIFIRDKFIWMEREESTPTRIDLNSEFSEVQAYEVCEFLGNLHPHFGGEEAELDSIYDPFYKVPKGSYEAAAFYPGSFSPWHQGHEACVVNQRHMHTIIIPDNNPWKEPLERERWNEVKRLWRFCRGLNNASLYVGFLASNERNPTVSWLPGVQVENKWLIVGDDSFLSLHKWKDSSSLLSSLCGLYVCPRQGEEGDLKAQAQLIKGECPISIEFLDSHEFQDLSSSSIRKAQNENSN